MPSQPLYDAIHYAGLRSGAFYGDPPSSLDFWLPKKSQPIRFALSRRRCRARVQNRMRVDGTTATDDLGLTDAVSDKIVMHTEVHRRAIKRGNVQQASENQTAGLLLKAHLTAGTTALSTDMWVFLQPLIGNDASVHLTVAVARNKASKAFGRLHRAPSLQR